MINIDIIDKPVDLSDSEWVGDIPGHPGVRFKVRSSNYKPFKMAHDRLLRSYGRQAMVAISTPEYQKAAGELLSEHILTDWEKAITKNGKPAKYDRKMADHVLSSVDDRGIGQMFRDAVNYCAGVVADRHIKVAEDISGN